MPYDSQNKQIYIDVTTTPRTGVSINDVRTALSESSYDLGTLCKSSHINPMAKYKPVEHSILGMTGKTYGNMYWRGANAQCGLNIPHVSYSDRVSLASGNPVWSRVPPTTLFRLLDFDGYDGRGLVTISPSTIPTGALTERNAGSISFLNGLAVFHVDLNPQDQTGFYLTLEDISIATSGDPVNLEDMYLRLLLVATDSQSPIELPSDAYKVVQEEISGEPTLAEMTLGEARAAGKTQITFSPEFKFEVYGVSVAPKAGDVYSDGNSNFIVKEIEYENWPEVSAIICKRSGGTQVVPDTGTLSRVSGTGSSSISYNNVIYDRFTFGSKTYYVFPFLCSDTTGGFVCGLGTETPQLVIASRTDTLYCTVGTITKANATTFNVPYSVVNGFDATKTVTMEYTLSRAGSYQELFAPEYTMPVITIDKQVTSLATASGTDTPSISGLPDGIFTGIHIEYVYLNASGHTARGSLGEFMFDAGGNPFTPPEQQI